MTETLSYNPTDPNAPEFSPDEQDSLEVAEKLGRQESELLAGKFENAEELENAYLNLQKKLGGEVDDDDVEQDTLDYEEEYDEATVAGIELIQSASDEYYSNEGQLSAETMDEFKNMSSNDLVNAYMAIQENLEFLLLNLRQLLLLEIDCIMVQKILLILRRKKQQEKTIRKIENNLKEF